MSGIPNPAPEPPPSDQAPLSVSMTMLSTLVRLPVPFPEVLHQVAVLAVGAVSGADGAWLTWCAPGETAMVAASREGLRRLDQSQYQLDEGPSLDAYEGQRVVCAAELGGDPRWQRLAAPAATARVRCVLALPLSTPSTNLGVLSLCSGVDGALGPASEAEARLFADHAAHTLANAHALASVETELTQLNQALASRSLIEQAKGIVMAREACSAAEAFDRLRAASQNGHVKLRVVAQLLVDSVTRESV